jgi:hypothetical protein
LPLLSALEELWRGYGRRLREVNRQGCALLQQPGESLDGYFKREQAMSQAERAIVKKAYNLQFWRPHIKKTV